MPPGGAVQPLLEDPAICAGAAGSLAEDPVAAGVLEGVDLEVGLLALAGLAVTASLQTRRDLAIVG